MKQPASNHYKSASSPGKKNNYKFGQPSMSWPSLAFITLDFKVVGGISIMDQIGSQAPTICKCHWVHKKANVKMISRHALSTAESMHSACKRK